MKKLLGLLFVSGICLADQSKPAFPKPKPLVGEKALACVGISYTKSNINDYVTADRCEKLAKRVAEFYAEQSRGKFKLKPQGYRMTYDGSPWKDFGKAEQAAKKKFRASYYIIPSIFRKGGNHAGGGIAHVTQMTGWVSMHEVGHLLGFGHTGKYIFLKDGKAKFQPYKDGDSVMGSSGTQALTAPQYYHRGWLNPDEYVMYDAKTPFYDLAKITNVIEKKADGLATVLVPNPGGRPVFVSYPRACNDCAALHFSTGGGTQRIALVKKDFYDEKFTQLHVKLLEGAPKGKVRVALSYDKPTTPTEPAIMEEEVKDAVEQVDLQCEHDEKETVEKEPEKSP